MTYTGGKVNIRCSQFRITLHPDSEQNSVEIMNDGGNTQNKGRQNSFFALASKKVVKAGTTENEERQT